jgi:hypothetical protein
MKTINELLIIMRDNIDKLQTGLCLLYDTLYYDCKLITLDEAILLKNYINNNAPTIKSKLFEPHDSIYYWPVEARVGKIEAIKPRLRWLNYHIKITSKKK